jgi:hypothetical protein
MEFVGGPVREQFPDVAISLDRMLVSGGTSEPRLQIYKHASERRFTLWEWSKVV